MNALDMVSKVFDFFEKLPSTFFILWMMCWETYSGHQAFRGQNWPMVFVHVMAIFIFFAWGVLVRLDRIKAAVKAD